MRINKRALAAVSVIFAFAMAMAFIVIIVACGGGKAAGGSFTDSRDKQKYRTVKIGAQTWMAENLNYKTGGAWCYGGGEPNCKTYGRLYDWETSKLVCPGGWHLPSREEWGKLVEAMGDKPVGKALKSKTGWDDYEGKSGNGTNDFGFSALPGGQRDPDGEFAAIGRNGFWWSPSEGGLGRVAYVLGGDGDGVTEMDADPRGGFSVRCVQDGGAGSGEQAAEKQEEEVDTAGVLHISDSIALSRTAMYSFKAKILVFDSISITYQSLLKSIYAPAEIATDDYSRNGLRKALAELKERYLSDYRGKNDWIGYSGMGLEDYFQMEVSSRTGNFLTINYTHGGFWGGAHGGHTVKTQTFDLKNNRPVLLKDIIKNPADKAWGKILKARFLAQGEEGASCVSEDTIPFSENFYFDSVGITFGYNQSEIAAYACGMLEIRVPFDRTTEKMLTPDFAKLASQNPAICDPPPEGKIMFASIDKKKDFSLVFALCDESLNVGYVQYRGQAERRLIQFDHDENKTIYDEHGDDEESREKHYNEIYNGKINGLYVLNMSGLATSSSVAAAAWHAYYIGKKDNQRMDLKIVGSDARESGFNMMGASGGQARREAEARAGAVAKAEAEAAAAAAAAAAAGAGDW
ncbi:MAG: DUF3298 domain-containing protein [Chitinispirillales bacterium]|jgi:uncharacterized protein (TIGR02145 family)|nr:DUF3298 domain-containing protein [Chitinispirillales bacterium]